MTNSISINWADYFPYLQPHEFECNCTHKCGLQNMTKEHMDRLYAARMMVDKRGIKFDIISGSRCAPWNKHEGGSFRSDHLTGEGTDIFVPGSRHRFLILEALMKAGFRRIGIGHTFLHAGSSAGRNPQEVCWLY
jgi:hypothetical protein